MKQKKENIVNYIENGKWSDGKAPFTEWNGKVSYVDSQKVETATGVYYFPKDEEDKDWWKKDIESRLRSMDRLISNRANYGHDGGKAAVFKPNKTELALAKLSQYKHDARIFRLIAELIKDAPKELHPALFENALLYYNSEFRSRNDLKPLQCNFKYEDVCIIPPAWIRGWEDEKGFEQYDLKEQMSDLLPSSCGALGMKTKCGYHSKDVGEIIGYDYNREVDGKYGRFVLYYIVKFGASRYDVENVRYDHLKPVAA